MKGIGTENKYLNLTLGKVKILNLTDIYLNQNFLIKII